MTTEEICMLQSEMIERQAQLIVLLLREVMQYRSLTEAEDRAMREMEQDESWDSVSK